MFNNVGRKVKKFAKVVCWVGIIVSVLGGIALFASGYDTRDAEVLCPVGIVLAVLGPFFSWIGSLTIYAVGEAAENSAIAANLAIKADLERDKEKKGE